MRKMLTTAVAVTLVVCIVMMSTVSYAYSTRYWAQEFSILNRGDSSNPTNQVKAAQRLLQQYYFTHLDDDFVDGAFGVNTQNYVRIYQRNNGLTVDGGIGPQTWGSMQSEISIAHAGDRNTSLHYVASRFIHGQEIRFSYEIEPIERTYGQITYEIHTSIWYTLDHDDYAWYLSRTADEAGTLLIND